MQTDEYGFKQINLIYEYPFASDCCICLNRFFLLITLWISHFLFLVFRLE